jgi:hypothetical protein
MTDRFEYSPGDAALVVVWPVAVLIVIPPTASVVGRVFDALSKFPAAQSASDILNNDPANVGYAIFDAGARPRLITHGPAIASIDGDSPLHDTNRVLGGQRSITLGMSSIPGSERTWLPIVNGVVAGSGARFQVSSAESGMPSFSPDLVNPVQSTHADLASFFGSRSSI